MALAFGAVAVIAALMSEPAIAAVAGIAAAISVALALLAPRLLRLARLGEGHERWSDGR
jgi:hypothetical protein